MSNVRIDWFLVTLSVAAVLIGIITLYGGGGVGETLARKKTIWLFIGLVFMIIFAFMNYQLLGSYAYIFYGVSIFLLILTLLIGSEIKGAKAWIRFFGLGFQPAELMKLSFVIVLSKYLSMKEGQIAQYRELFFPFILAVVPMFFIAIQPDLGYSVMLLPILFTLLFLAGADITVLVGLIVVGYFSLFVPMYLEYQKYMLIEPIVDYLREDHYKLADAIRYLGFDTWQYIDNMGKYAGWKAADLGWARATLFDPENLALFQDAVIQVKKINAVWLRDYLSSDFWVVITAFVTLFVYGVLFFFYQYYYRIGMIRKIAAAFLMISLSLTFSFFLRKVITFKPHQVVRIVSFANPDKFPKGAGYQLRHSMITLGSGQLSGKGFYQGDMTKGDVPFLPEWYNDFIFSVVGEQFGFWGGALVIILLMAIVLRGISIAWQSKDTFGALLAGGISSIIFLHILINIGIAMGLMPVTGIPLTFVSYGGSNMLISFISIGILLNINMRRFTNV